MINLVRCPADTFCGAEAGGKFGQGDVALLARLIDGVVRVVLETEHLVSEAVAAGPLAEVVAAADHQVVGGRHPRPAQILHSGGSVRGAGVGAVENQAGQGEDVGRGLTQ